MGCDGPDDSTTARGLGRSAGADAEHLINAALAIFLIGVDRLLLAHYGVAQTILYEKIDLIRADNRQELIADLNERTGQRVKRYIIEEIDFLRDTATLTVYFDDSAPPTSRRS